MSQTGSGSPHVCVVSPCDKTVHSKGRCQPHYRKFAKYGTDIPTASRKKKPGPKPDPSKWRSRYNLDNPTRSRPKSPRTIRTQCKRGHDLVDENVYLSKTGSRSCRVCLRENTARWRALNPQPQGPGLGTHQKVKTHCPQGHLYDDKNTYKYMGSRYCKKCSRNNQKKHYVEKGRYKKYGITRQDYQTLVDNQSGRCAICSKVLTSGRDEHIDHDHLTGNVRGVLCGGCNLALGKFRDSPEVLIAAAKYLMDSWIVEADKS